jgi:FkbM family methyltransferase
MLASNRGAVNAARLAAALEMRKREYEKFAPSHSISGECIYFARLGRDIKMMADFDETYYRARYPDVARAVEEETFTSARQHYDLHGKAEGRRALPPSLLVERASGTGSMADSRERGLLAAKARLEAAMYAEPRHASLRRDYTEILWQMSQTHLGPIFANLPEIITPLMLRGGSSDLANFAQIFVDGFENNDSAPFSYGAYGFRMPVPSRILDLGAYCGFSAVYFANRFPSAQIIAVEPPGPNFESTRINSAGYANIRCVPAAVWSANVLLRVDQHILGDWGQRFARTDEARASTILALTLDQILAGVGWDRADFIKYAVAISAADILRPLEHMWLAHVNCIAIRPLGDVWEPPEDEARLISQYPEPEFGAGEYRGLTIIQRREPKASQSSRPDPVPLLLPVPQTRRYRILRDGVANDLVVFHRFGDDGLRMALANNESGTVPVVFSIILDGHDRFVGQLLLEAGDAEQATVRLHLRRAGTEREVASTSTTLTAGLPLNWTVAIGAANGEFDVVLEAMPGGTLSQPQKSWVTILDPRFEIG